MKKTNTYLKKTVYALVFIVIVLLVWQVCALIVNDEYIVPSLYNVCIDMLKIFYVEQFYSAYFSTLFRAFCGFALSIVVGVGLAFLAVKSEVVRNLCSPLVSVIRLVPTMAIVALLCLTLSPSLASIVVCCTVVMPYAYSSSLTVLSSVSKELLEMAKVYKIPHRRVISGIYLPTVKIPFLTLLGTTFSFSLKITVSAEVVAGALKSMGGLINLAKNVYLSPSLVCAITVWTVLSGLFIELVICAVIALIERRETQC
ncbi:MAG: ABC transporter permease subunit [Clostridiales bacterium]|nr:ABC transporter permease subunit [Clostridiales bacterium]